MSMYQNDARCRTLTQQDIMAIWSCVQDELLQDILDLKPGTDIEHVERAWDYSRKISTAVECLLTNRDFSTDINTDAVLTSLPTDLPVCDKFSESDLFSTSCFGHFIRTLQGSLVTRNLRVDKLLQLLSLPMFDYFNCSNCGDLSEKGLCADWAAQTVFHNGILANVSRWSLDLHDGGVVMDLIYGLHVLVKVLKSFGPQGIHPRSPQETFGKLIASRLNAFQDEQAVQQVF